MKASLSSATHRNNLLHKNKYFLNKFVLEVVQASLVQGTEVPVITCSFGSRLKALTT